MFLRRFTGLVMILFVSIVGRAQDLEFSQFYANRMYLNPALAGAEFLPTLSLSYRNQWPQNSKAYRTYSASFDGYVSDINSGLGIMVLQDNQGDGTIKTAMVSGSYSYRVQIKQQLSISMGIKATYVQHKLDWNRLIFSDMIEPIYGVQYLTTEQTPDKLSDGYIDFSLGGLINYKNFYFGVVIDHLSQPNESFYSNQEDAKLPMKYTLHTGIRIPIPGSSTAKKDNFFLSPNLLYQKQEKFEQINYGLYLSKNHWVIGGWLRHNLSFDLDAVIALVGYQTKKIRLAYSYDYVISNLMKTNSGAHEISLSFVFGKPNVSCKGEYFYRKKKRIRAISCPNF